MRYRLLADAILLIHFAFVLWVVLGLIAVLVGGVLGWRFVRRPWFRGLHLAAIGYVVVQAWLGVACPLTIWEGRLRELAGQDPYDPDGFVAHWVRRLMFFDLPLEVFVWVYTAFGLLVLVSFVLVPVRRRHSDEP